MGDNDFRILNQQEMSKVQQELGYLRAKVETATDQIDTLFTETKEQSKTLSSIDGSLKSIALAQTENMAKNDERCEAIEGDVKVMGKDVGALKKAKTTVIGFCAGVSFVCTLAWNTLKELF